MLRVILSIAVLYSTADVGHGVTLQLKPYNDTALSMFFGNDLDFNGHIERLEFRKSFRRYDLDGNGVETRFEYTEYICGVDPALYQLSHYMFDEYDLNGDHSLTMDDFDALFDNLDSDKDELVDLEEFVIYWGNIFPKYEGVDLHTETLSHGPSSCH